MEILGFRIRRAVAGKYFPFDRVYLAKAGEHHIFKQMFRYAFIMPLEPELRDSLCSDIEHHKWEAVTFKRNDVPPGPVPNTTIHALQSENWVLCVPILTKWIAQQVPRYITAAGKYRLPTSENAPKGTRLPPQTADDLKTPFPNLAYLQTPDQDIRPICLACPRIMLHQNGHCRIGEPICYTSLALGLDNHFQDGLNVTPPTEDMRDTLED